MEPWEQKNVLLTKLRKKEYTMAEFLRECAYWALTEGFDELRHRPNPMRPRDLLEYDSMSLTQKQKLSREFWMQKHVQEYINFKASVDNHNNMCKGWLSDMAMQIPKADVTSQKKIEDRLKEFR